MSKPLYLANEFSLTKPTITTVLDTLLKKELIVKKKDEKDKRSYFVQLTKKGKQVAVQASGFANLLNAPLDRLWSVIYGNSVRQNNKLCVPKV